jgi:hypothetical protein
MTLTFQLKLESSETDGSLHKVEHRSSEVIWGRSSRLVKQKLALKNENLTTQIYGKCNDISSADVNK